MVERNERETLEGGYDISLCLTVLICTYVGKKVKNSKTVTNTEESKFESILKIMQANMLAFICKYA